MGKNTCIYIFAHTQQAKILERQTGKKNGQSASTLSMKVHTRKQLKKNKSSFPLIQATFIMLGLSAFFIFSVITYIYNQVGFLYSLGVSWLFLNCSWTGFET